MPGTNVTPHNCKIQEKDEDFYRQFHIVICGLDSIVARRWINGMVISLLHYDDDGKKTLGHAITFYVVICLKQEYRYMLQWNYFS